MSGVFPPGHRPDQWSTIGDHDRRIRALEAVPDDTCCPPDPCISWTQRISELAVVYSLRGWWTLDEAASPWADTSGDPSGPDDMAEVNNGGSAITSVAGAIDGNAIQLNNANTLASAGRYLQGNDPDARFNFGAGDADMTLTAFVKPVANANNIAGGVISKYTSIPGVGWSMWVEWPTRNINFTRNNGTSAVSLYGPVIATTGWTFVAATYDGVNGHRIYIDGVLAASDPSTFSGLVATTIGPYIGFLGTTAFDGKLFQGGIDEVTVWGGALTEAEIAQLYASSLPCSEFGVDGQVLTTDGAGDTSWAFPTVAVDTPAGRYNTINVGPGLVGTDEGDDSVTFEVDVDDVTIEVASPIKVKDGGISEVKLGFTDITTADTSVSEHGLAPKLSGDATTYLDGTGAYTTPAGTAPIDDTDVWMPLTSVVAGDPVLVWDGDDSLIPTLIPI